VPCLVAATRLFLDPLFPVYDLEFIPGPPPNVFPSPSMASCNRMEVTKFSFSKTPPFQRVLFTAKSRRPEFSFRPSASIRRFSRYFFFSPPLWGAHSTRGTLWAFQLRVLKTACSVRSSIPFLVAAVDGGPQPLSAFR